MKQWIWMVACAVAPGALLGACGGGSSPSGGAGSTGTGGNAPPSDQPFAACGGAIIDPMTGAVDAKEYQRQARLWDRATIDCRLGPKFADLHPGANDPRPTAVEPEHKTQAGGYLCKTYELGGAGCPGNCDYGSTSGQVLYASDDMTDPGVDRVQTYGYEKGVICESPQTGKWLGGPHPDPGIDAWSMALGHPVRLPNGFSQTEMWETNAGIMTFQEGLVGATGNQTAGDSKPYFVLPKNKVPTSVAVTSYNELALVTIWDTDTMKGQVAVFALRADSPPAFSVPYFALPNEGGFKSIHLLGYIDLPDMATPTAVAVSGNNGGTPGGHAIGNEFKNFATDPKVRQAFSRNDNERWVADSGQAVALSQWEGKVSFIDMRPLFQFIRDVYFTTDAKLAASIAQDVWPYTFDNMPQTALPVVVTTVPVPHPKAARVGNQVGAFAKGLQKSLHAFVADQDGEVRIFDVSAFSQPDRPVPAAAVKQIGMVQAGKNITSMTLRGGGSFNSTVIIASRGDRAVQWITVGESDVTVTRTLEDARLVDPVVVDASDRGPVVTVGDFDGRKLINYRVGATENNAGKPPANYGCGPGGVDATCATFECGGEFSLPGSVYFIGTTNVN